MSREELAQLLFESFRKVYEGTDTFTSSTVSWGHIAAELKPEIERLLSDERAPMKCGHPKACLVTGLTGTYEELSTGKGRPIEPGDLYYNPSCSVCTEREKVRKMR